MTKLKIDLVNGVIEVEGEESFVKDVYSEYKERFQEFPRNPLPVAGAVIEDKEKPLKSTKAPKAKAPSKQGAKKRESYTILGSLSLSPKGEMGLREFYAEKTPVTAYEKNTVFVYYLQNILKIQNITLQHIYSCYKEISGSNTPVALLQSVRETGSSKGWVDMSNLSSIVITIKGENFVENDLPSTTEKKAK